MKKSLSLIIILIFTVSACKKTIESEQKSWERNKDRANQLTFQYPNFSQLIKEQVAAAELIMNEVSSITDEKAKISKMAEANAQIMKGFVRNLEDINSVKTDIRKKAIEAKGLKALYNEMAMINHAISASERTIMEADLRIKTEVKTRAEADSLTGLILTDLKNAESNLDRAIETVKDRESEEKSKLEEKQKETQKQLADDKAAKEKAEAPVMCEYCGTSNPASESTCKQCGASLK
jgi:hypothetical protein